MFSETLKPVEDHCAGFQSRGGASGRLTCTIGPIQGHGHQTQRPQLKVPASPLTACVGVQEEGVWCSASSPLSIHSRTIPNSDEETPMDTYQANKLDLRAWTEAEVYEANLPLSQHRLGYNASCHLRPLISLLT